jgi:hypothetical protein
MSGRPVLRALAAWIEEAGGDLWVFDQIADGVPVGKVAEQITLKGHGGISRPLLYQWRDMQGEDSERRRGWAAAMKDAAHAHAEKAGEVWDTLPEDPTTGQVQRARGQSEYRRWLAGHRNREDYGEGVKAGVVVNIGSLHLDALRQAGHIAREEIPHAEVLELPAEIEEVEE